jgi:hypothetical protein
LGLGCCGLCTTLKVGLIFTYTCADAEKDTAKITITASSNLISLFFISEMFLFALKNIQPNVLLPVYKIINDILFNSLCIG